MRKDHRACATGNRSGEELTWGDRYVRDRSRRNSLDSNKPEANVQEKHHQLLNL